MLSQRSRDRSGVNALSRLLGEKRAAGVSVCDLTASNPTWLGVPYREQALRRALTETSLSGYRPEPLGSFDARRSIAGYLSERKIPVSAERLVLTASTSEAYGYLFKLLCDGGERVLVPRPSYPLLAELARYENVQLRSYDLNYDGAWHIDFQSLESNLDASTKAVVVVSPNNPTGHLLQRAELQRLLDLGVPLIGDEVFWAYPIGERDEVCSVLDTRVSRPPGALLFRLDGLSKLAALPGLKLAWITVDGDDGVVKQVLRALEFISDTYLSVNAPVQAAVTELLRLSESTREALRQRLQQNLATLDKRLVNTPISRLHLEAGWYAVLRLPRLEAEFDWSLELLSRDDVLVQPGWFYDFDDAAAIVISLIPMPQDFNRGISRLVARVTQACEP